MTNSPETPALWAPLTDWTLLAVEGPQAMTFLQGQVTCDLRNLANASALGAHCSPKGRMIFSFRALQPHEECVLLRIHSSMLETAQKSLGKYIVFAKAELRPLAEQRTPRALSGPEARARLTEQLGAPAEQEGHWVEHDGQLVLTLSAERFECWLTPGQAALMDEALATSTDTESTDCTTPGPTDNELWRLLDIRAGLGEVLPETREQFTPQAFNFPQVGAVSFRKGCYTGQEVVARLHYKGKLKRTMQRLVLGTPLELELSPAALLHDASDKKLAELVVSAPTEDGRTECLAVMENKAIESVKIEGNTFPAQRLPLPYSVDS